MASREEEMQKLKARYAQTRGNKVEQPIEKKKTVEEKVAAPRVASILPHFSLKPYLNIIEDDVRRVFGLKSIEEIKKENTYDPLIVAWKRSRNMK